MECFNWTQFRFRYTLASQYQSIGSLYDENWLKGRDSFLEQNLFHPQTSQSNAEEVSNKHSYVDGLMLDKFEP